ncbi:type II secretion system F family protein [Lacipirellula sp.]|uniref:type II secretion system F family protein n=1 Tax=Lacipirellula sp. TaxID=2691419 RepID=UPI003D12533E
MPSPSLDDFMALNDQLTALVRADVPLGLGLGTNGDAAAATLEKVNAGVARRVSRGESLADAIGDEPTAPALYRRVMQAGWRSGNAQAALASSSRLAEAAEETRYQTRAAFFYPALVALLALAGIAGFVRFVLPTLVGVYREFRIPEGPTLRLIESLRTSFPWLAMLAVAVVIIAFSIWFKRRRADSPQDDGNRWNERLSGGQRAHLNRRIANCCDHLATLVEGDVPLIESLPLAAEASGESSLVAAAESYAVASAQQNAAELQRATLRFPPFLRWALWQPDESISRPAALRIAAQVYRGTAERYAERTRLTLPMLVCIFLGGGVTLAYGLLLFVPMTDLLQSLAQ